MKFLHKLGHNWETRFVVGIPFRLCLRCKKMERLLGADEWQDFTAIHGGNIEPKNGLIAEWHRYELMEVEQDGRPVDWEFPYLADSTAPVCWDVFLINRLFG